MYENEENRLFGPMITAPHICLLLLLIYVGGLTADIENQVIVVKPFLTESSGDHTKALRVWVIRRPGLSIADG